MEGHRREVWQLDSREWLRFAASLPAETLSLNNASVNGVLLSGRHIIHGMSVLNVSTNGGQVYLQDGLDTTARNVAAVALAAGGSLTTGFANRGIIIESGLWISYVSCVLAGSIFYTPLWDYPNTPPGH